MEKKATKWLQCELVILFVIVPVLLSSPIWISLKVGLVFVALGYCLGLSKKEGWFTRDLLFGGSMSIRPFLGRVLVVLIAALGLMVVRDPENLFLVVRKKPLLWLSILFFYSFFSVYPQEFLYRLFFFQRYRALFNSRWLLVVLNAIFFSLAHLMFWNGLVLILTIVGGLLFALTYERTKSLTLVSVEHALYGCWLFTLGMGDMLGFPSPR